MIKKLEEVHDDIVRFIVNNMEAIITEISDAVDSDNSQQLEYILNLLFHINLFFQIQEDYLDYRQMLSSLTNHYIDHLFVFYIDIDENGEYRYYIPFNKDGGFDFEEDIVEEPQSFIYRYLFEGKGKNFGSADECWG